ncbi:cysteine protease ATG4D isoform X2 [Fopius arisanus]|uniref:Cysteine protease n=1 Tax=Fopius arisanus TaxID=64838 RepID=A0A9R1TK11_9HYME|nr:PREDICTED: cysteine protease ATG4D isoform X2 [Fopius arisanus]XP_011310576.1 PREDICTED: cysteine protease ATG4D isoform X2 [Fopius arisanus]
MAKYRRLKRGGLATTTTSWFTSLTTSDHISGLPESAILGTEVKNPLSDTVLGTEADSKMKTKLLTMWHNVKYGWTSKLKTNFSKESPVWLLGASYHKTAESPEAASEAVAFDTDSSGDISIAEDATNFDEGMEGFKRDFVSRLWLTYRREFPILNGSTFTSDCGWGCMLRSGQMMLAQALVCHFLGRAWRWRPDQPIRTDQQFTDESKHRMIIKWFGDQPATQSPFSIHSLVSLGASTGKRAGDWYGPASVAYLLGQAVGAAASRHDELENLSVYVAQDCAVYLDDVRRCCERADGSWKSLVLLVPLRLGVEKLNAGYGPCLTALLSLDICIGVIGGRPRHSLYFIGYQDDKLIHLDPHYCQEAVDVWKHNFSLASFHCSSPRKMLLSKMDPSCCVGFYLHDKKSLENFIKIVEPFLIPPNQKVEYPMFLFCEGSGDEMRRGYEELPSTITNLEQNIQSDDVHYECEEFEFL